MSRETAAIVSLSNRRARRRLRASLAPTSVVVVERHRPARLELARRGLADVVQQRREAHDEVGRVEDAAGDLVVDRLVEHRERVLVHVLVVVVLVDLEAQRRDLGQHAVGEARVDEQPDAAARRRGEQQLRQLVAHALGRDAVDLGCELGHRGARALLDLEAELGREPGGAQHPQRVVAEGLLGSGGRAQGLREQVLDAAGRIDERRAAAAAARARSP